VCFFGLKNFDSGDIYGVSQTCHQINAYSGREEPKLKFYLNLRDKKNDRPWVCENSAIVTLNKTNRRLQLQVVSICAAI
jgi:hypothetical protein